MATDALNYWIDYRFNGDQEGAEPTSCSRDNCMFGVYQSNDGSQQSPGCETCGVIGLALTDIFDPEEGVYQEGAPEDYKTAAAVEIVMRSNKKITEEPGTSFDLVGLMATRRPVAVREILRYAKVAGVDYIGTDLADSALET